jgi:D-beta-D-heptose 7-phosphate kinase / D-beta-D-heptose 1-phosphate adenosyltransferase|tara:strand:+ start:452 stop:850 length:399 start_codon:yes stop_codon:yes gene_type:complete
MFGKVIFTNGCFDIIHRGHIELLRYCHSLGESVIVGINSDESIKKLKGKNRPINNQEDRKFLLESLKYVSEVVVFDEDTPYNLIKSIRPDIIIKGGDYQIEEVVGNDICKVVIFDYIEGHSTTETISRIANR